MSQTKDLALIFNMDHICEEISEITCEVERETNRFVNLKIVLVNIKGVEHRIVTVKPNDFVAFKLLVLKPAGSEKEEEEENDGFVF